MIRLENHLGLIEVSQEYFNEIVGNAVSSCFGVAGMANTNARQGLRALLRRKEEFLDQGVRVYKDGNGLVVDLHIIVTYGLNISVIVRSIVNKVRYTVEGATGLEVRKVNVFVDGMLNGED
ncbi:MAG: Asp23/Gls24 family envelope stress response protein [Oscillospiraceae bacterium]|nr:Asp23/Gls24 family envelope stress response protein [Oscillospiraceae bacterium]